MVQRTVDITSSDSPKLALRETHHVAFLLYSIDGKLRAGKASREGRGWLLKSDASSLKSDRAL
jgi:hypothetical protein